MRRPKRLSPPWCTDMGRCYLRVCRSALRDVHDAEDASQAVFLILARRAGSVRHYESAASWLYGVARRVAALASATPPGAVSTSGGGPRW